jgi:DNA-binding MarR family transcriptional regulator
VSRRTFYDVFEDREDCFLAVFNESFARILERLSMVLHEGGSHAKTGRRVPGLTGEGVVGAVVGVIHSRLSGEHSGSLMDLLGPLMGVIVLPYEGPAAAQRELDRPMPRVSAASKKARGGVSSSPRDPFVDLPMRLTYRTLRVLIAVGEQPDASNREVADVAGVTDQGQMSKLLTRLEKLALIENTTEQNDHPTGEPNAWHLTARGEEIVHASHPRSTPAGTPRRQGETQPAPVL